MEFELPLLKTLYKNVNSPYLRPVFRIHYYQNLNFYKVIKINSVRLRHIMNLKN